MDVDGTQPWHKGAPYVPTTIGHIPTCAQKALEFVKFFPGEERCAALRPFMIRYKLFPENCKDPKVAPITMNELKGLVRMWKLHNQKGFWAEHKTRDSIVLSLYERMQFLGKESRDRRARRDADRLRREGLKHSAKPVLTDEERATLRLQALSGSSGNRRASLRDLPDKDKDMTPCIMYRSRGFGDSEDRCNPRSPSPDSKRRQRFFAEEGAALEEEVVEEDHKQVLIKRKCSTALLNMSLNKKMSSQFVEQGGLHAILDLASTCRDDEIITNCAAALNNLIPFGDNYPPQKLCDLGVVKVVVALVNSDDARVRHFMALCLCKMSEEPGLEDRLATQGALTAATRLVAVSDSVRTKEIAAKVLINLAVGLDGNQADTTVKAVLRCVAVLVTHRTKTGDPDPATQQFCAEAILVLACLPQARPVLAKQGVVALIKVMFLASTRAETTNACAAALCNMGQSHSCRKEILSLGLVKIMSRLMKTGSEATQKVCTLCLTGLAAQADLRPSLLKEGALRTIAEVVHAKKDMDLTKQGAGALLAFAFDPATREDVVLDGLGALIALLDADMDSETQASSLMALCNLIADAATCPQVLEAGVLVKLVGYTADLQTLPSLVDYIGIALLNVSTHKDVRLYVARTVGCLDLVIELLLLGVARKDPSRVLVEGDGSGPDSKRTHSALKTLLNLALDTETHETLLERRPRMLLDALALLVYEDRKARSLDAARPTGTGSTLHLVSLLVHLFTTNKTTHDQLLHGDASQLLVTLAKATNDETRTAVAGSLYNMTQLNPVADVEAIEALVTLSRSLENERVLWCAWCFANLSTYPKGRATLGKLSATLVPALLGMMRSGVTDAEKVQYHCAVAVCNTLSVFLKKNDVLGMIESGTVQDVIVITVLRANDVRTKQVLAQALFNLLARVDTRREMIANDVPMALVRLTRMEDPILNLLATNMLKNLSCEAEKLIPKLLEMRVCKVMVDQCLSPSGGVQIKRKCAATLANLAAIPEILEKGLAARESNVVAGIRAIAVARDAETLEYVATIAYYLSAHGHGRDELVFQEAVPVLASLCQGEDVPAKVRQLVIAALTHLSNDPIAHEALTEFALPLVVETMAGAVHAHSVRMNAMTLLCNLIVHYEPSRSAAVAIEALPALKTLVRSASTDKHFAVVGKIMRDLTWDAEHVPLLIEQGAMALAARLAKQEPADLKHDVAAIVTNLCACGARPTQLIEEDAVGALFWLTLQDLLNLTKAVTVEAATSLRYLAQHAEVVPLICDEANLLPLLLRFFKFDESEQVRYDGAVILYYCLAHEPAQKALCRAGAIKMLSDLASTGERIREVCSAALHQLPNNLMQNVDGKLLGVLMGLLDMQDANFTDPSTFHPDRSLASTASWPLLEAIPIEPKTKKMKAEWPTSVIEKSTSAFVPASIQVDPHPSTDINPALQDVQADFVGEYRKMSSICDAQTIKSLSRGARFLEDRVVDRAPAPAPAPVLQAPVIPQLPVLVESPARPPSPQRRSLRSSSDSDKLPAVDGRFLQAEDVAASDALANASITSAFRTGVEDESAPAPAPAPAASTTRRRNPRKYAVAAKMKQKDRIADDYYELLNNVA